jgi:hypothetical protein
MINDSSVNRFIELMKHKLSSFEQVSNDDTPQLMTKLYTDMCALKSRINDGDPVVDDAVDIAVTLIRVMDSCHQFDSTI